MPLTMEQKAQIKSRFLELRDKLAALVGARNPWEKAELGKNRDWRKIADMIAEAFATSLQKSGLTIDGTNRMALVQYPDCFVCVVMEKKCYLWDGNPEHRDCPELLFEGFCYAEMPANDFNRNDTHGLFKRQVMHKRSMMRLAMRIANSSPDAPAVKDVTRYCKWHCKSYEKCCSAETLYAQYLLCENTLEDALKETIGYVDEIIGCARNEKV